MDDDLLARCNEKHRKFLEVERGGPLLFKLMMDELLLNTREAANHLVNQLETTKLQNIQGEKVTDLTSIVQNTAKHLENMKDPTTNLPLLPADLNAKLLTVLQTSSVTDFNEIFHTIEKNAQANAVGGADPVFPSLEELCAKADARFKHLVSLNLWTGVNADETHLDATFVAKKGKKRGGTPAANVSQTKNPKDWSGKQLTCDNCGSDLHFLSDCPLPKNDTKIAAAKKARSDAKKKSQCWQKFARPNCQ